MKNMKDYEVRDNVRESYAKVAKGQRSCCGPRDQRNRGAEAVSKKVGYSDEDIQAAPAGSNMGLGCGNPTALASLKEGEVVLDLGSGGGFDCFLAAKRVGTSGKVIGVDMTPEMVSRARQNAESSGDRNVEFRLGEIENLPAADNSVDVVISNCVINLSPDKEKVFKEAYRVLRKGGRLIVSDIVLEKPLPGDIQDDIEAYSGCIAGASRLRDYIGYIKKAGFRKTRIEEAAEIPFMNYQDLKALLRDHPTGESLVKKLQAHADELRESVKSIRVSAIKTAA